MASRRPSSLSPLTLGPPAEQPPVAAARRDQLVAFRPAILGIRVGTTAVSAALASPAFAHRAWWTAGWCALIVTYNVGRSLRPLRYLSDTASLVGVLFEVALPALAVAATDYWRSPFVFSLMTAVIVAGFARGFGFAARIGTASALAVSLPSLTSATSQGAELRTAVQWTVVLVLVALVAGYGRRVTGDADRRQSVALDRLGLLADANTLLFSLHRITQTLPASLDLEEVLDSTLGRMRDLFSFDSAAILLLDETDGSWEVARFEGSRPSPTYANDDLPRPLRRALADRVVIDIADLQETGAPGLSVLMSSGLYAVLPARQSVVGLLVVEHREAHHFAPRDAELLGGFAEPAALAIDNARWFARLRTVGADEERTRIARDLHDRIGQSLAYLAFELDRIVKADARGEAVGEKLDHLRTDVRGVIGEVRDTLYDLRTDVSESQDLTTTLTHFLERVRQRSRLETSLRSDGTGRLPLLQEREVWRIAQEAVTNTERHARATHLSVMWRCDGSTATLEVTDDGIGFRAGTDGRLDSYGIMGMRERAASIGATLEVHGQTDVGTTVHCEVHNV